MKWIKIYYGFYEINRKGIIRRAKEGKGTHIGRVLHPYEAFSGGPLKVDLCRNGKRKTFYIDDLYKLFLKKS